MADQKNGLIAAGFSLVWRRQCVVWWVYIVNLILAIFTTLPVVAGLGRVMNNSLYSARLYHGFDLMTFAELLRRRGVSISAYGMGSMGMAILFFIIMLFLSGGILTVYVQDQTLSTEDFFRACGRCLWRFFRLVILLLIVMVPVDFLDRGFRALSNYVSRVSPYGERSFLVAATGWLIVLLILMAVRLWFDLGEVHIAGGNERASRRALGYAWRMLRGNFWYLYWVYFRIGLLAYVGLGVAFWIWVKALRPESVGASFLFGQAVIFIWLFTRLWQRASESIWYNAQCAGAIEPVPVTSAPEPATSVAAQLPRPEPA